MPLWLLFSLSTQRYFPLAFKIQITVVICYAQHPDLLQGAPARSLELLDRKEEKRKRRKEQSHLNSFGSATNIATGFQQSHCDRLTVLQSLSSLQQDLIYTSHHCVQIASLTQALSHWIEGSHGTLSWRRQQHKSLKSKSEDSTFSIKYERSRKGKAQTRNQMMSDVCFPIWISRQIQAAPCSPIMAWQWTTWTSERRATRVWCRQRENGHTEAHAVLE